MENKHHRKTIDETLCIYRLDEGSKLYLYTSANGLKGICGGHEFWVTERSFFNDPMEFQIATNVFCEVLDKHMHNKELCGKIKEKVTAEVKRLQTFEQSVNIEIPFGGDYIISLSKDCDSPLMWGSYANYVGYCIQFDYEKLLRIFEEKHKNMILDGEVVYNHDKQIRLIEKTIEKSYFEEPTDCDYLNSWSDFDEMTEENIEHWYKFIASEVSAYNMFFKLPCFEDEHEYRFIFMVNHNEKQEQYFRIREQEEILIPYIKVPFDSLEAVEKIFVGPKNQSDIAIKGVQYMFQNLKHNIVVEKSRIPLRY